MASTREHLVAPDIVSGLVTSIMRFAVHLDREARFHAGKIERGDVWMLTSELEASRPFAKVLPQQHLG